MSDRMAERAGNGTESEARRAWIAHKTNRSLGSPRTHLIAAAAACSAGRLQLLADVVTRARARRHDRLALEEAVLQCYLFAGYPRAIDALTVLQEQWPRRSRARRVAPSSWERRGLRLCRRVYGRHFDRLRSTIARANPDLARWMIHEGYGKVLSRPDLDAVSRELCAVASLIVLQAWPQLEAHIRGALNVGARPAQVRAAVRLAALGCGARAMQQAQQIMQGTWSAGSPGNTP